MKTQLENTYKTFHSIYERLSRVLGKDCLLTQEYANRLNEVAQLGCTIDCPSIIDKTRERLAYVQLGIKHHDRRDWDDDRR